MKKLFATRSFALALVVASGFALAAPAMAQSTAGMVFGHAPAGDSVSAHSTTTGTQRTVHVQADGRYSLRSLPTGVYNVTLEHDGNALVMHKNVTVAVGRGVNVDFDCGQDGCAKADSRS